MIRQSDTILTKAEFDIISQPQKLGVTVACIIVRRLLISVHKWQSSGNVWLPPMNIGPNMMPTLYIYQFFIG